MDSVRFGRVLGIGTRLVAKTLVNAVDAATAPNPSAPAASGAEVAGAAVGRGVQAAVGAGSRKAVQAREAHQGIARGGRRFGEAVWGPFVRLSGVLWLEFTGVFFGIFALYAGIGVWQRRGDFRWAQANHAAHQHLLWMTVMAAVFGYFCVSSFVHAGRRGRRR